MRASPPSAYRLFPVPRRLRLAAWLGAGVLALSACGQKPVEAPPLRPVKLMTVGDAGAGEATYPAEIRARVESRLGFRVPGKIRARLVDVGATVRRGQPLASLDASDYALAQDSAQAALQAAQADRDVAAADLGRYRNLFDKGFISAAEFDRRQVNLKVAQSRVDQAEAALRTQRNQTGYATLVADADGIVTGVDAEVGQVVSAGQSVIRLARNAELEAAFNIPEDRVASLRAHRDLMVSLWADPGTVVPARVREIAGAADPATRTFAVRASIPRPPAGLALGMTASVKVSAGRGDTAAPVVPLSALLVEGEKASVWAYDGANGTVRPIAVRMGQTVGDQVEIRGVPAGQTIVVAGVHLLKAGMKVRPLDPLAVPAAAAASAPAVAPAAPKQGS